MSRRVPLSIPDAYLRIREFFGNRPFSAAEVERVTGKPGIANYVALSRLARRGWVLRLARGRYVAADPLVRLDRRIMQRLEPFAGRCYYSILYRTVGAILRVFAGDLIAIAVFGSVARGTAGPESDVDILVVVRHRPASAVEEARVRARLAAFSTDLRVQEWESSRHFHQVQPVVVDAGDLRRPGPLFLDMPREAWLLWDPTGVLRSSLRQFAKRLRGVRARPVGPAGPRRYWVLGRAFREARA